MAGARDDPLLVARAPWLACAAGQLVYLAVWWHGVSCMLARVQGQPAEPGVEDVQWWVGVVAFEYVAELLLIFACGVTIFPRWRRPDITAHHLPFSLWVFASLWLPGEDLGRELWRDFQWTSTAVLCVQGIEALECFQTIGGEAALYRAFGVAMPAPKEAKARPGPVERTRLLYAMGGIAHCASAEMYEICSLLWRLGTAAAAAGAVDGRTLKLALACFLVLPALSLHVTLLGKYSRRLRIVFLERRDSD